MTNQWQIDGESLRIELHTEHNKIAFSNLWEIYCDNESIVNLRVNLFANHTSYLLYTLSPKTQMMCLYFLLADEYQNYLHTV